MKQNYTDIHLGLLKKSLYELNNKSKTIEICSDFVAGTSHRTITALTPILLYIMHKYNC